METDDADGTDGESVWEDSDDEAEPTGGKSADIGEPADIDQWITDEPVGTLTMENIERDFMDPA